MMTMRIGRLLRTRRDRLVLGAAAAVVAAALATGGVLVFQAAHQGKQVTAYFTEAIGVYPGSTVRVLGVPVGTVGSVQPRGTGVKVTMTVNAGVPVPADAKAVVVAASVVSDRYVQLTPAYTGGPQLAAGAVIPVSRTAVPVEVDQIYTSINRLSQALGPNGLNHNGALSELAKTGAANLNGNGANLHAMITQFGALSKTLGDNSGNLFATVTYLQRFTSMLKANDGQVRQAEQQLADVFGFLASDRQDLSGALHELSIALGEVQGFIANNRGLIKSNVAKLASITQLLVDERASLAEALGNIPLAADNVVNAYDATNHTLDSRGDLNELSMGPGANDLQAITPGGTGAGGFGPAGALPLSPSALYAVPPLPLPAVGLYGTPGAVQAGGSR
jgi:phospholipid/cholesterol/gamma-HCH transport system substrate-binding protein